MGPCKDYKKVYFYDPFELDCRFFTWGGNECPEYKYVVPFDE
jgi:hypothetical protein